MKIAVISDTHNNLSKFKKAAEWMEKQGIKVFIHCGDVQSPSTLIEILKIFKGKVFLCLGNADYGYEWHKFGHVRVQVFQDVGEVKIDKKNIAFCHFPEQAKNLAKNKNYDIVFYGHTHKPWEQKINNCCVVNPGNLAGIHYLSTFAIYDTLDSKLTLKILKDLD